MIPCKQMDLRGWKLLNTDVWRFGIVRLKTGRLDVEIRRKKDWDAGVLNNNESQRITVKVHRKSFNKETIIVRSIYFFRHRQPTIQLWKICHSDCRCSWDIKTNIYDIINPWWQREFYVSVKIDDKWHRLEEGEYFSMPIAHCDDSYALTYLNLLISEYPSKKEITSCQITR